MTGLGIATYNRPEYLKQCLEGIEKNLLGVADSIWIYNDGSSSGKQQYKQIYKTLPKEIRYKHNPQNKGVAHAKNWLLRKLLDEGCDYIFLIEDDIIVKSPKAITEYVRLSKLSGIEHFMFAHHGTANEGMLYHRKNGIDLWTACVGAYAMYTANAIKKVGYFDENFINAWEHVEHTFRIQRAGLTTPYPTYPDLTKSKDYLKEIPGSIDSSSIRVRGDWTPNMVKGLIYWQQKDKDFPYKEKLKELLQEV